MILRSGR
jgi:hypothetical protein